tara:strand:+ start:445 stop:984 length:540 start_codon:yes stop_codon:yes gene_type:complete
MDWEPVGQFDRIADAVDAFLNSSKSLAGTAEWREGNGGHDFRASYVVLVNGEHVGAALDLTAYPNLATDRNDCRFTISLNCPHPIWRIDFEPLHKGHSNPLDRFNELGEGTLFGPHYHAWQDNRHLATKRSLPKELPCARSLPAQIRKWEQAFRWFCGQTGITLPAGPVIDVPQRTLLV